MPQSIEDFVLEWQGIASDEMLRRLVALNAERAEEEAKGIIRHLRPSYQSG